MNKEELNVNEILALLKGYENRIENLINVIGGFKEVSKQKDFLTRKETSEFFSCSLVCIHDWVKKGIIKPYKAGNRTYFKHAELVSVLLNSNKVA